MRCWMIGVLTGAALAAAAHTQSLAADSSARPILRQDPGAPLMRQGGDFGQWTRSFRGRALAAGIRANTFDNAFRGVKYNKSIIERDRDQPEFTKQIWEYLDTAVSRTRIANGKAALSKHKALLRRIEERYGVDKEIVVAIWGLETAYGARRGSTPTIEALASLAYDPRRSAFFETQLLDALRILQSGDISPARMKGSWAGAMGHTQFMPSSYVEHAVDLDQDGRRDIWSENPADALASTAAYLRNFGWRKGQPWGIEVRLPEGFDYSAIGTKVKKTVREWAELGVARVGDLAPSNEWRGSILLPAGHTGPAFLVFRNFRVIERYNAADAYVIGVGHLADRIKGGGPIKARWPRGDRALSFAEKQEMQRRLRDKGFDPKGTDGLIGSRTIAAVRAYQASIGWIPDGYASLSVLERLRGG